MPTEDDYTSLTELAQEFSDESDSEPEDVPAPKRNKKSKSRIPSPKKEQTLWESCQKNVKELFFLGAIVFAVINPWTVQYLMKMIPNVSDTIQGTEALEDFQMLNWKGSLVQLCVVLVAFLSFKVLNFYEIV